MKKPRVGAQPAHFAPKTRRLRCLEAKRGYRFWGERAGAYDDGVLYVVGPAINQEIRNWLMNRFEDTDMVLELGCGTGIFSEMIVDRVKHLTATDSSPEMIEKAREKLSQYGNVKVRIEDCYETSFEDNTYDAVLLANLLHIVKDPVAVLGESHRVLKDGGTIIVADYTTYGVPLLSRVSMASRAVRKLGLFPHNRPFSPDGLARMVKGAGFVVEESRLIGKDTKAVCLRGSR